MTYQRWGSMTFLHWPGFEVHTFDGSAWVSITPFLLTFRLAGLPHVPGMTTFPDTNLRTYVRGPDGRDGIWFLSLEADCLPLVVGARARYRVPYRWASMRVDRQGPTVRYRSRRRPGPPAGHDITVRVGGPCEGSEFDHWLSGRWRGWTRIAGRSCRVPAEHRPWSLCEADVVELDESLFAGSGLIRPWGPPLVRYSPGIDVRLGSPQRSVFPAEARG